MAFRRLLAGVPRHGNQNGVDLQNQQGQIQGEEVDEC